ncbi:DNA-(apurinic or apyrimidinic site) lyase 2 [Galdieria sulphuraria]|nr:DNA-(apurinic or apyrimidinic site) lyase 2 [Galdieria sulphuraria]
MRLCTWNVNGLESLFRKGYFADFVYRTSPDILCLQETKISRRKLAQWSISTRDWNCFLSICKTNEGYSGVSTFCQSHCPLLKAEEGISGFLPAECLAWNPSRSWFCNQREIPIWRETAYSVGYHFETTENSELLTKLDKEGRCVIVEFPFFILFNVYVPFDSSDETFEYKYIFIERLLKRIKMVLEGGKNVVVCGDFNCARERIDHCDPEGIFQNKPRGSLFESDSCRQLFNVICSSEGPLVDVFRYFHPERLDAYTCWNNQTGARKTNFGTRIDYILANRAFVENFITNCDIFNDIYGSDHCPVYIEFRSIVSLSAESLHVERLPPFCCQHFPDLLGSQQSLKDMMKISIHDKSNKIVEMRPHFVEATAFNRTCITMKSDTSTSEEGHSQEGKYDDTIRLPTKRNFEKSTSIEMDTFSNREYSSTVSGSENCFHVTKYQKAKEDWRKLFHNLQKVPLCSGHNEPCLLRTVKKKGANLGRKFYVCGRPIGKGVEGRCNFFLCLC